MSFLHFADAMPHDPLVGQRDDWRPLIEAALAAVDIAIEALTYSHFYSTASRPVAFKCSDGNRWVVKAQFAGRGVAADSTLLAIGCALGAPVATTGYVNVSAELIAAEPRLQQVGGSGPMQPGIWHGAKWIDGIHDTANKRDDSVRPGSHNSERFGRLALMYGWCGMGDRQFVYENDPPYLVHVVDMGHTLPNSNGWNATGLDTHVASATIPMDLWTASGYNRSDAQRLLTEMGDPVQVIARAAAKPRDHWGGITLDERIALAHYLSRQFDALRNAVSAL